MEYDELLRLGNEIDRKEREIALWRNNLDVADRDLKELNQRWDREIVKKQKQGDTS